MTPGTSKYFTGDEKWITICTLTPDDLLEMEVPTDDGDTAMVSAMVTEVQPATKYGVQVEVAFIGSNDQGITDTLDTGATFNVHLCQFFGKKKSCSEEAHGTIHCAKFRKHSDAKMRALKYVDGDEMTEVVGPGHSKPTAKEGSLSSAMTGGTKRHGAASVSGTPAKAPRTLLGQLGGRAQGGLGLGEPKPRGLLTELGSLWKAKLADADGDKDGGLMEALGLESKVLPPQLTEKAPGKMAQKILLNVAKVETSRAELAACVHAYVLRKTESWPAKFFHYRRELLTLGRQLDHTVDLLGSLAEHIPIDQLMSTEPDGTLSSLWKAADVSAVRFSAVEHVVLEMIRTPTVEPQRIWDHIKYYEIEPPTSSSSMDMGLLGVSMQRVQRENKMTDTVTKK